MRDCLKNTKTIYQKRYTGIQEQKDDDGYETGVFTPSYGNLVELQKNVVSFVQKGTPNISQELFGLLQRHEKIIMTSEPIDVGVADIFWIDAPTTAEADYKVQAIYKGLDTQIIGLNSRIK